MDENKRSISTTTDGKPPAPGLEDAAAPQPIKENGQHAAYWVLTEEERSKGFLRPVRHSYQHVGRPGPRNKLRDLTDEERERYDDYIKFEEYPESESPATGRFWTQDELDNVDNGCMAVTTMSSAIAETYARNPHYYGSTFCVNCGKHLSVGKHGEFIWVDDGSRVGS